MQANYVQRLRLTFSKMGPARYIGHLDLSRTLERSFNRAQIPLAYTQGFNRRPRLSLAAALPLGFTSEYELADIWLTEEIEPAVAQERMMQKIAPGLSISHIVDVNLKALSLQSVVSSAAYEVFLPPSAENQLSLLRRVEEILAAQSLPVRRKRGKGKTKEYDLRPLILSLSALPVENNQAQISMELCLSPTQTGRPDDVLDALSLDPYDAHIHRTKITLSEPSAA